MLSPIPWPAEQVALSSASGADFQVGTAELPVAQEAAEPFFGSLEARERPNKSLVLEWSILWLSIELEIGLIRGWRENKCQFYEL